MRGRDDRSEGFFSYVRLGERIPKDHPLRPIRALADEALASLNQRFEGLYSAMGRPSIAPEMLLRATLLQAFFSVRSERMLMEQVNYNLLFRWFVGLPMDAEVWHPTVFTTTATGSWKRKWRMSSWRRCWPCRRSSSCCRASTSRSTAR
jgi:transposase